MYPDGIPDSILRLAGVTRPDQLKADRVADLQDRVMKAQDFVADWVGDERFWSAVCRSDFRSLASMSGDDHLRGLWRLRFD